MKPVHSAVRNILLSKNAHCSCIAPGNIHVLTMCRLEMVLSAPAPCDMRSLPVTKDEGHQHALAMTYMNHKYAILSAERNFLPFTRKKHSLRGTTMLNLKNIAEKNKNDFANILTSISSCHRILSIDINAGKKR